jgi:hypothetical protein
MSEGVTSQQAAALNQERLAALQARMDAARLLLAHRELGAGLDVDPRTKVRSVQVEEQRVRDVAKMEARDAARKRDIEEQAIRRMKSLMNADHEDEPESPPKLKSILQSSHSISNPAQQIPGSSAIDVAESSRSLAGSPNSESGKNENGAIKSNDDGRRWGKKKVEKKANKVVSSADKTAKGLLGFRALTETEGMMHANVKAADNSALNRGGFKKLDSSKRAQTMTGTGHANVAKGLGKEERAKILEGLERKEFSFDSAAELVDLNEQMDHSSSHGKKKKKKHSDEEDHSLEPVLSEAERKAKADAEERKKVKDLFVPGGIEVELQRRQREKLLEAKLKHVQSERLMRIVEEIGFDPIRSTMALASVAGQEKSEKDKDMSGAISPSESPVVNPVVSSTETTSSGSGQDRSFPELTRHLPKIMRYIACKISVSYDPRKFAYFFLSPVSTDIVADCFWLVHTRIFAEKARQRAIRQAAKEKAAGSLASAPGGHEDHPNDEEDMFLAVATALNPTPETTLATEILVESIAAQNFELLQNVSSNKYLFSHIFPYAVAGAVHTAFLYLLPGSANAYTSLFKLELYLMVTRLLSGVELAQITVAKSIDVFFPQERAILTVRQDLKDSSTVQSSPRPDSSSSDKKHHDDEDENEAGEEGGSKKDKDLLKAIGDKKSQAWARAMGFRSAFDLFKSTSLKDRKMLGMATTARVELMRKLEKTTIVPSSAFLITGASVPQAMVAASASIMELVSKQPEYHKRLYHDGVEAATTTKASSDFLSSVSIIPVDKSRRPPPTVLFSPIKTVKKLPMRPSSTSAITESKYVDGDDVPMTHGSNSIESVSKLQWRVSTLEPPSFVSGGSSLTSPMVSFSEFPPQHNQSIGMGGNNSTISYGEFISSASMNNRENSSSSSSSSQSQNNDVSRTNQGIVETGKVGSLHSRKRSTKITPSLTSPKLNGFLMHPLMWQKNVEMQTKGGAHDNSSAEGQNNDASELPPGGEHSVFDLDYSEESRRRMMAGLPALPAGTMTQETFVDEEEVEANHVAASEIEKAKQEALLEEQDVNAELLNSANYTTLTGLLNNGLAGATASAIFAGGGQGLITAAKAIAQRRVRIRVMVHLAEADAIENGLNPAHAHAQIAKKLKEQEDQSIAEVENILKSDVDGNGDINKINEELDAAENVIRKDIDVSMDVNGHATLAEMTRMPKVGSELAFKMLVARSKARPLCVPFVTTSTSTLVHRALPHIKAYEVGQPRAMLRSITVPWSKFGGLDTFRAGADVVAEMAAAVGRESSNSKERESYEQIRSSITLVKIANERNKLKAIAELNARRDAILAGGAGAVSQAAAEMKHRRAIKQRERLLSFERMKHERALGDGKKKVGGEKDVEAPMPSGMGSSSTDTSLKLPDRVSIDAADPGMKGAVIVKLDPVVPNGASAEEAAHASKYTATEAIQLNLFNLSLFAKTSGKTYSGDPLAFEKYNKTQAKLLREKEEMRKAEAEARAQKLLLEKAMAASEKAAVTA